MLQSSILFCDDYWQAEEAERLYREGKEKAKRELERKRAEKEALKRFKKEEEKRIRREQRRLSRIVPRGGGRNGDDEDSDSVREKRELRTSELAVASVQRLVSQALSLFVRPIWLKLCYHYYPYQIVAYFSRIFFSSLTQKTNSNSMVKLPSSPHSTSCSSQS